MNSRPTVLLHISEKTRDNNRRTRKVKVTADSVTIGNVLTADIEIPALSQNFLLEIKYAKSGWWVVDPLKSNLIRINGRLVELDSALKHGDQILLGEHHIFFEIETPEALFESTQYAFPRLEQNDESIWKYLIEEKDFDEILINGSQKIYVDWKGNILLSPWTFSSDSFLVQKIHQLSQSKNEGWVSWRENRQLRFQAALPPLVEVPHLAIRKARANVFTLDELEDLEFGTPEEIVFLKKAVEERQSILISGATSSGKTVLLRSLVEKISPEERLVILEEEAETDWPHPHAIGIETGRGNLRKALIESLRMRPSRIIVSEVRGEEAFEFLQALNTGHEGGMTTIHANSPRDALSRIENLILTTGLAVNPLAVRSQLAQTINIIVQLERTSSGKRQIESISRISGIQQGVILLGDPIQLENNGIDILQSKRV